MLADPKMKSDLKLKLDVVIDQEDGDMGTADALRHIQRKIKVRAEQNVANFLSCLWQPQRADSRAKREKSSGNSCGLGGCCVCTTGWPRTRPVSSHQAAPCGSFHYLKPDTSTTSTVHSLIWTWYLWPHNPNILSRHPPLVHFCPNRWGHSLNWNSLRCQFRRHGVILFPRPWTSVLVFVHIRVHVITACMSQLWLTSRSAEICLYESSRQSRCLMFLWN